MGETIRIAAHRGEGAFAAYLARPQGPPRAAILVVQEIFGVNRGIRAKADDWAALGYLAVAPDMFWRFAPGYDVDPDDPKQAAEAFKIRTRFDADRGIEDIEATIRRARGLLGTAGAGTSKVGVVGFCMGGRIAYLAATRTDADASVGYYGARIDQALDEAAAIANPLLLHLAEEDHLIPPSTLAQIERALAGNRHVTLRRYAGVDHGFADTFGRRRADAAAQLADERTRAFFAQHLG